MNNCPHCGRKLLSHISPKCSWCGAEIKDAEYQAQAAVERAALEAEQVRHDQQTVGFSNIVAGFVQLAGLSRPVLEKRVVPGAWVRRPERTATDASTPQPAPAPEAPAAPVSEAKGRFDHLEL